MVYLAIATSILVWSNAFIAIHVALRELTPLELVQLRFLPLTFIFFLYLILSLRKRAAKILRERPLQTIAIALLLVPAYNWLLYEGQKQVSPALASILIGSSPAFTYLAALSF